MRGGRHAVPAAVAVVVALALASGCGGSTGGGNGSTLIVSGNTGVVRLDTERPGQSELLPNPQAGVDDAVWSPDGKAIAWVHDEQLFVTDENGEHLRLVGPAVDDGLWGWSPDSRQLDYDYNDISLVKADGTDRRVVVRCKDECGLPAWSPDGKRFAVEEAGGLELVDPDSGHTKRLVRCVLARCAQPGCGGACGSTAWSPDGKWIAFAAQGTKEGLPRGCGLGVVRSDGTHARSLAQPSANTSLCSTVVWSADGKLLALERFEPSAVALYRRSGDNLRAVRVLQKAENAAWSPDGRRFAYLRNGAVLWLADANGAHARRVGDALEFEWSPDGSELAVTHGRASPSTGPGPIVIWIVDAANAQHRVIWPTQGSCVCGEPHWQPE